MFYKLKLISITSKMAPKNNPKTTEKASSKLLVPTCLGILLVLFAYVVQIFYFSPIPTTKLTTSDSLQGLIKVGEGSVNDPEDASVDKNGVIYTATRDGWTKRLQGDTWVNWKFVNSSTLLGITATKNCDLIICDNTNGLFNVSEDSVENFLSYVNGSKLSFTNDVIEASDGSLYFTVSSTKYTPQQYNLDEIDGEPHGQLLKYDPSSNKTILVADGLYFANGVALSKDEDYVVVCESWKFRCRRYWLKGEREGQLEAFTENLPGAPDNVNIAPDGTFWIAIMQMSQARMNLVQRFKIIKYILEAFPKLINILIPMGKGAQVVNVALNGTIIRNFDDPTGQVMSYVTSGLQVDNSLYIVSPQADFIGKMILN